MSTPNAGFQSPPPGAGGHIALANQKTQHVQSEIREAKADLHAANSELAQTSVSPIVTRETVSAVLEQNRQVEEQLHDAVEELQEVTELLKTAQAREAAAPAGRSGTGAASALQHLRPAIGGKGQDGKS